MLQLQLQLHKAANVNVNVATQFTTAQRYIKMPNGCAKRLLIIITVVLLSLFRLPAASANPISTESSRPGIGTDSSPPEWLICAKQDAESRANCSVATEKLLLQNSTNDLEALFYDYIGPYAENYKTGYEDLILKATTIIAKSDIDVQASLNEIDPSLYDDNKSIFDRFYLQLNLYARTTVPLLRGRLHQKAEFSLSPAQSVRRIFRSFLLELTERIVSASVRTTQLPTQPTANYFQCVLRTLNSSNLSDTTQVQARLASLLGDSIYAPLERPLIAIRIWLNVFLVINKFTRDIISQTPITEECIRAFGAVKMCSRCSSSQATRPCQQTCDTVAQTCLNLSSDFTYNWNQFIETANTYARQNDFASALNLLPELLDKFSRDLTDLVANVSAIDFDTIMSDPVFEQCNDFNFEDGDPSSVAPDAAPLSGNSSVNNNRQQSEQTISSSSLIHSVSGMFRSLESAIIAALCDQTGLETNCWNGETQLRTNPRSIYNNQLDFDSAVNYTQRQAESVEHSRQFYNDYALLFRDYTGQIRTGGTLPAGHTLLSGNSSAGDRLLLPCKFGEPGCSTMNDDETESDDEFGDDEIGSGDGAPYSDDEGNIDFSGSDLGELEGSSDGCNEETETNCSPTENTTVVNYTSPTTEQSKPKPTMSTEPELKQQPEPPTPTPTKTDIRDLAPQKPRTSKATRMHSSYPLSLFIFYATFAVLFHLTV